MVDRGHELTEEMLQQLEGKIAEEFAVAVRDMEEKLQKYLEASEKKRQYWEGLLNEGKITRKEYQDWCYKQAMVGKRWEAMRDTLAQDMHHANEVALRMATGRMPDVYALNHNYGLYEIERASGMNTGLTLYNHDTAAYLLREDQQLMPGPSAKKAKEIAANKDMQWNQKKIQSAVLQGVLQGEGPSAVAKRLMKVGEMNYSAAVRYARTMTTSAQNAGRYESYHRANRLGIPITIEWQAVLDSHTRHDHRKMHGQRRNIDEPFMTPDGFQIYYPADSRPGISTAPQSQIWNCRCTLRAWVKGHEGATVTQSAGLGGQSFEEWQGYKSMSAPNESLGEPKPGKRIEEKELENFTKEVEKRGYRFAQTIRGVTNPTHGGFENFQGNPADLYSILDELDGTKSVWPEKLRNRGVLIGYESFGDTDDFARTAGRTILFNKKVYDDSEFLRRSYAAAVKNGMFAQGTTPAAVPWHEIGHVLQNMDKRIYPRLEKVVKAKGEIRTVGLLLTSKYGIFESEDMRYPEFPELLSELLSASRSSIPAKRNAAAAILRKVL